LKLQPLPSVSALFDRISGIFPKNRLAVQIEPPGGSQWRVIVLVLVESPGGDGSLPGDATLFALVFVGGVLMLLCGDYYGF